ncbi:unnamed protein product [Pleuronectes platessa]|uniref:Uncharacterized protein n=1 Tax=Pleuronectes platessa TaxID=8262 RepID=A0A9N7U8N1_PLEPL|nr:unnamed protein product [Pleuronectes platessa]
MGHNNKIILDWEMPLSKAPYSPNICSLCAVHGRSLLCVSCTTALVQHLAQGHFGMQMGQTGDLTADLQVGGRPLYPSATDNGCSLGHGTRSLQITDFRYLPFQCEERSQRRPVSIRPSPVYKGVMTGAAPRGWMPMSESRETRSPEHLQRLTAGAEQTAGILGPNAPRLFSSPSDAGAAWELN